jgi:hypothetical protein
MNITVTDTDLQNLESIYSVSKVSLQLHINDSYFGNLLHIFANGFAKSRSFRLPAKKEINKQWVASKIETVINSEYENLRPLFEKLKLSGYIYYTSFGFSYDCFLKSQQTFDKETQQLQNALTSLGVEFRNEFSDARWVYRFRLSQSKENLSILSKL